MAFVLDQHDPGKQGMFSKAGRFTTEKYIIFQRKDEIMFGKKRVMRVSHFTQSQDKDANKMGSDMKKKDDKKDERGSKKEEKQPFNKQISREQRNATKSVKHTSKGVGYYKPKYTEIDKSQHQVWNILKVHSNKTLPRQVYTPQYDYEEEMTRPIPESLMRKRVTGNIELDRCLERSKHNNFMFEKNNPHEDRFKSLTLPMQWSNMKKSQTFSIDKSIGREDNKGYFSKEHQPDYNPNYSFGKKDFSKCGLQIEKVPGRKPFFKSSDTENENFFEYDKYSKTNRSNIFRNIKSSPNFDKILPREIDPSSPLPSFMQKHVNMRSTLSTLHHKMLENNYFSDGRFQSTASEFTKSQQNFRKSQKEEEDEEDEESFEQAQQQQKSQQQ